MIVKGHRVYRGHRAANTRLPSVLLFVVVALLLVWLGAFSLLPQYLVYHRDHVEMVVPMLEESGQGYTITGVEGPQPYPNQVSASLQVVEPDYADVNMASISGLGYLNGYYIPFSKVTEAGLDGAVKEAQRSLSGLGVKGLVLEMKNEAGNLAWMSAVAMASSNAANSNWDPSATLAELKADGWYLVARVCCGVDTLLATRSPEMALHDATGAVYADASGKWVDLWNRDVRNYTVDLCADLLSMGFDEIILYRVEHPVAQVSYSREIGANLNRVACVTNFAIAVRQGLDKALSSNRAHLCAYLSHDALTEAGASNGQTLDNFLKVFDRVVIPTATYSEDAPIFTAAHIDSTIRFVPQMTWGFGGGSWILDPSAPTA